MPKLKDITVFKEIYDPHLDGYLITGKLREPRRTGSDLYICGWRSRFENHLVYKSFFPTKGALTKYFNHIDINDDWPDLEIFKKDRQKERVYKWEFKHIFEMSDPVNRREAHELVRQVSEDYGIKKPTLTWLPEGPRSHYSDTRHQIGFAHRDQMRLLHELAHAIHCADPEHEKGADHSPAFVRIAVELYHRYAGIDLSYLLVTANQYNILGDMHAAQNMHLTPKRQPR